MDPSSLKDLKHPRLFADNATTHPAVTWDPSFFPAPNATVNVQGNYLNSTTGAILSQAFSSGQLAAAWSFYAWTVDKSVMTGGSAVNITLQLAAVSPGSTAPNITTGPTITVANKPGYTPTHSKAPTGPALYIGLPTILGFVAVALAGTCLWNRKARQIGLGNVMSRGRHGYGVGKSRAGRMAGGTGRQRRVNKEAIVLMQREVPAEQQYHDAPPRPEPQEQGGRLSGDGSRSWEQRSPAYRHNGDEEEGGYIDRPRRDSDCLGSLAGTPTEDRQMRFLQPGGQGNVFRDELERQNRNRQGVPAQPSEK